MAYTNTINQTANNTADLFTKLKEWWCDSTSGPQWELYDSNVSNWDSPNLNEWFVVHSDGEDGKADMYYKIIYYDVNYLRVYGYLYWNASSDSGVIQYGNNPQIYGDDSSFQYWAYGDKDTLVTITKVGIDYYFNYFGRYNTFYDSSTSFTTESVSSGSNVWIPVDYIQPSWEVNKYIFINDHSHLEKTQIIDIDNVNNKIQVSSLNYNYSSNAQVRMQVDLIISNQNRPHNNFYVMCSHRAYNNEVIYPATIGGANLTGTHFITYSDPDKLNNEYLASEIHLYSSNTNYQGYYGTLKHILIVGFEGISDEDVIDVDNGLQYRVFYMGTSNYKLAVREV